MVGTRAATPHGLADARELGGVLARAGVVVVSGLAIGIDAAVHEGALDAGGAVIGVIATGLDVVYPRRHQILYERVRRSGLLVTEHAFGVEPRPQHFPVRNRVIAALGDCCVVVEATASGGAMITARHALDYGRAVLAMPGSRRNPSAAGTNALIAEGAHPLIDPEDALVALGLSSGDRRHPTRDGGAGGGGSGATPEERSVFRHLSGEPATADELVARTGLSPGRGRCGCCRPRAVGRSNPGPRTGVARVRPGPRRRRRGDTAPFKQVRGLIPRPGSWGQVLDAASRHYGL